MAAEWFYTTNKQQMGPVTWNELRELAEVGILKPHDLVWSDGMDEWVKAISQESLFADGEGGTTSSAKKASYKEAPKPPPNRRTGRKEDEEDEDDREDSKEAKRQARKKQEERAKMAVGLKVGLILGGVVFVLLFLVCGGVGLFALTVGFVR